MKTNKDIHSTIGSESCLWVSYILASFLKDFKKRSSSACSPVVMLWKYVKKLGIVVNNEVTAQSKAL